MKRVEVEWIDSASETGWRNADEAIREAATDQMMCWTCGYLVAETDAYLLLALNRTTHPDGSRLRDSVGDTIQIPRVAVLKMRTLR